MTHYFLFGFPIQCPVPASAGFAPSRPHLGEPLPTKDFSTPRAGNRDLWLREEQPHLLHHILPLMYLLELLLIDLFNKEVGQVLNIFICVTRLDEGIFSLKDLPHHPGWS